MRHHVIIETHRMEDGTFRADGIEGPWYARGLLARASHRDLAFAAARIYVEGSTPFPDDTFSFLHAET